MTESRRSVKKSILESWKIDRDNIPEHVAIIMDGNGRWAKKRGLARIAGHREAVKSVRAAVEACSELDIKYLTLFAFSVDNWKRPKGEVDSLMKLLRDFIRKERKTLVKNKIRFMVVGDKQGLPEIVRDEISETLEATEKFDGHTLILALNYGGRTDILQAVKKCAEKCVAGYIKPQDIDEDKFKDYLFTTGIPDPDLLIRTSGELRISNFMLWQISYTEIYITKTLWPDFRKDDLFTAIADYSRRERRFGGVMND